MPEMPGVSKSILYRSRLGSKVLSMSTCYFCFGQFESAIVCSVVYDNCLSLQLLVVLYMTIACSLVYDNCL